MPNTRLDPAPRSARRWAALLGLLSAVLAVAVPFLPVEHEITTLRWPTAEGTHSVSAPLVSHAPLWLTAEVPCRAARDLDARTSGPAVLVSTNAPSSFYGGMTGLSLQVDAGKVVLWSRGRQAGAVPVPDGDCVISVRADATGTSAAVAGAPFAVVSGDQRPQLTGIFSQLDSAVDDVRGLAFEARVDDRFASRPTPLKIAAMVLEVLAFLGAVVALRRIEVRRAPRGLPPGWWRPGPRDVVVFAALVVWWLIGAMTADDGYILTMLRAADSAGYVTNYFRWFANPESPFGWFYELYALWVQVSAATPWVRLPALFLGALSWLLLSRGVLPRLGRQVRGSGSVGWAAAAVFLAFWLPYNNGLRPEPVVVTFFLLSLCAVERAVASRRLTPAALGLVAAALGLGANPHGMIAVLPFVVAAKPLIRLGWQRIRERGALPVLAPVAAAGLVILVAVFFDQTLQSVVDSVQLKTRFGPNNPWYAELSRYDRLFGPWPDGSLTRRFPVLLLVLCVLTSGAVLLRRGRISGAAVGPSRRVLAVAALCFVVLALTPTKHTHHFGVLAGIGSAVAALTALATSAAVLRSRRNRALFAAGLMVICAFSVTGTNSWWYVSGWGVPWFDTAPKLDGRSVSTYFLAAAAVAAAVALVEHLRHDELPAVPRHPRPRRPVARWGAAAPLTITCAVLLVGEVALFAKGIHKQWDGYSLGADNVRQLIGTSCGLSDYVEVETDPRRGMLAVSREQPRSDDRVVSSSRGGAADPLQSVARGFHRFGVPSGQFWSPPYGFGGDDAPVWGSFTADGSATGELRTSWYDVPPQAASGQLPVVVSFVGSATGGNSLAVEWGRDTPHGFEILGRRSVGQDAGRWRDVRFLVDGATKLRVVAVDQKVDPPGWLAVSAPRVPVLSSMTEVIGGAPVFVEWPAALVHPCLDVARLHHGIAELPAFRVIGGGIMRDMGYGWSAPGGGGPYGWFAVAASVRELPTYLRNDLHRDWGALYVVDPYQPDALPAAAALQVHTETHWGTWSPGPLTRAVRLPGALLPSDGRTDVRPFGAIPTGDAGSAVSNAMIRLMSRG
ncbi:arabinosyltransferase domain-containing protein [Saccharopolyspora thermophila]|uniref:Arabinosyltransferase domain-containing protein n=1 Tax=Saccharopolyspora thermophila TaxID=89367 RepID=A0ABP3MXF1_9PSEU